MDRKTQKQSENRVKQGENRHNRENRENGENRKHKIEEKKWTRSEQKQIRENKTE